MKRLLTTVLAAALLITGMAACGSKDAPKDYGDEDRVLYNGSEAETETDEEEFVDVEETDESDTSSDKEKKDAKTKDASSKAASSKAASSKKSAASSKAASSKKTATASVPKTTTTPKTSTAPRSTSSTKITTSSKVESKKEETSSKDESKKESKTDSSAATDTEINTDTASVVNTDTENTNSQGADDTDSEEKPAANPFDGTSDLTFTYGSVTVSLGAEAESIIADLGDDYTETEAPSCLDPGQTDKKYDYGEYAITVLPDGTIGGIELKTPSVRTEKDIAIGDPIDDALAVYGDGYTLIGGGSYRYYSADGKYFMEIFSAGETVDEIKLMIDTNNI